MRDKKEITMKNIDSKDGEMGRDYKYTNSHSFCHDDRYIVPLFQKDITMNKLINSAS